MLRVNLHKARRLDPRLQLRIHNRTATSRHFARSLIHDMGLGVGGNPLTRPNLSKNYRKRIATTHGQYRDFLEFMEWVPEAEELKRQHNEENPIDDPEATGHDEWNWTNSVQIWNKLMTRGDPDPMGALMAAFARFMLFYRRQFMLKVKDRNHSYNNGQPGLQAHTLPYFYRGMIERFPTWNKGISNPKDGFVNLRRKYPSWRMFLEDVEGIFACGRYADVKRAQPVFRPLRKLVDSVMPPFSLGVAVQVLNGLVYNNAVRASTACTVDGDDVYKAESDSDDDDDEDDEDKPTLYCAITYGTKKSTNLNIQQHLQMPGNQHGDAGFFCAVWMRLKTLLVVGDDTHLFVGKRTEAYQAFLMRTGGYAGLPSNWLKTTGYKVAKITEMYAEALILGEGIAPGGVPDFINCLTGHRTFVHRTYIRDVLPRVRFMVEEELEPR